MDTTNNSDLTDSASSTIIETADTVLKSNKVVLENTSQTLMQTLQHYADVAQQHIFMTDTYIQLGLIGCIYLLAFWLGTKLRRASKLVDNQPNIKDHPIRRITYRIDKMIFPLIAIVLLKIVTEFSLSVIGANWILDLALTIAVLLFVNSVINACVSHPILAGLLKWMMLPLLFLHMVGWLRGIIEVLQGVSVSLGNIEISAYGLARVLIFGTLLFWIGRASNTVGQDIIRKQESLDIRTREVFAKLFEVALVCVIALLLLNVMGINLTALAVFGGAVGVGLGFGLQSIASNFISGIIILLDRSVTIGDYIEMEEGQKGFVRHFKMRYTTLETYDGKDIMVPNEKFISSTFVNWSHKNTKQRYRVDFSVAYQTDIRAMVEIIKEVVGTHPQILSGEDYPIEERPDCEIDSFGDSGVNVFVEFWMEGIDDGKNRVGGDLMLMIFETLREHNISIPFPQREVRVLNAEQYTVAKTTDGNATHVVDEAAKQR
ncbi:mechanosensitive ion channel domain-containing protein [Paraglaciecola sp. 20A4]|uniref:mechanosensitive ion channel domain-containing protein n=1 Tax=Paraglaciecola sp. 20A4 TaxID=2687288 RepID=UPI00140C5C66